jgi:hypothetical protein
VVPFLVISFAGDSNSSEYYPFKVGRKLLYSSNVGIITEVNILPSKAFNGQSFNTVEIVTSKGNNKQSEITYFIEDESGIKLARPLSSNDPVPKVLDEDEWEFAFPLKEGNSWPEKQKSVMFTERIPYTDINVIEKMNDEISVPAGTFKNCMMIKSYFKGKVNLGSYGGEPEINIECYRWYAPGVGQIKYILKESASDPKLGGGEIIMELKSIQN